MRKLKEVMELVCYLSRQMVKRLWIVLIVLMIATNGYCASEWAKLEPTTARSVSDITSYQTTNNEAIDRVLSKYRNGCYGYTGSNSTFYVSAGEVVCSNSAGTVRRLRANTSATSVAWTAIDAGSEANSTVYYYYAIADADSANFTITISTSSSVPTGVTYYKKLGAFWNNASGHIEIGGIIEMYSGYVSALPPGYVLCDGTNGTPDLTDRFIIGAGNLAAVGASGGGTIGGTESSLTCTATTATGAELKGESGYHPIFTVSNVINPYYALAYIQRQGVE